MGVTNRMLTTSEVDQFTQDAHITIAEAIQRAHDTVEGWYAYMTAGDRRLRASAIDHLEYAADQCTDAATALRVLIATLRA